MAVMAVDTGFTRAELDAMPDDGYRHELIDGAIIVTPSPGFAHQVVVGSLHWALRPGAEAAGFLLLPGPFDVVLGQSVVVPDLLAARRSAFTERDLPGAPELVIEVRSPSTARIDIGLKRDLYARSAVPWYWLVDPRTPSVTVLHLVAGEYEVAASAQGEQVLELAQPWPVALVPAKLLE